MRTHTIIPRNGGGDVWVVMLASVAHHLVFTSIDANMSPVNHMPSSG